MTADTITISLQGPPQGKGRARSFVRGGRIGHYTPQKTRSYEALIEGEGEMMRNLLLGVSIGLFGVLAVLTARYVTAVLGG